MLFQIVDDILDVTGSDEELGKPSGSDERHGKLHLRERLRTRKGARASLRVASKGPRGARPGQRRDTDDLIRITDFIHTRHT